MLHSCSRHIPVSVRLLYLTYTPPLTSLRDSGGLFNATSLSLSVNAFLSPNSDASSAVDNSAFQWSDRGTECTAAGTEAKSKTLKTLRSCPLTSFCSQKCTQRAACQMLHVFKCFAFKSNEH